MKYSKMIALKNNFSKYLRAGPTTKESDASYIPIYT